MPTALSRASRCCVRAASLMASIKSSISIGTNGGVSASTAAVMNSPLGVLSQVPRRKERCGREQLLCGLLRSELLSH